MSSHLV